MFKVPKKKLTQCTHTTCKSLAILKAEPDIKVYMATFNIDTQLRKCSYDGTAVIDAEDKDVYVNAANVSHGLD